MYFLILPITNIPAPPIKITQLRPCRPETLHVYFNTFLDYNPLKFSNCKGLSIPKEPAYLFWNGLAGKRDNADEC